MALIYPEEFWATYGFGAKVYDATGRRMRHVLACNPETGEVITCDMGWIAKAWLMVPSRFGVVSGEPLRRHGFWPAPLRVVSPEGKL